MHFRSLDDPVRACMVQELDADIAAGRVYLSRRLTETGAARWPALLHEALSQGTPASLAAALRAEGLLHTSESKRRNGRVFISDVPESAALTLAEGEYNRFYIRGVCMRAIAEGRKVTVYRAKAVPVPRSSSEALIGTTVDPAALLEDLRGNPGSGSKLGIPPGPNSGVSVFIG
ncbi:hypothetical protein [Allorhizocola rhizosphaerae]|uniref:hypothetical protein n=1 Tax=Allorhizocola rhizosphaerae TaxID=1872709 RepID=UPI000E3D5F9E|nr:hypothetical protein [Allorhizocola rhizosphaerae]